MSPEIRTRLVKLKGKSGWACRIYVDDVHRATVAHPERTSEAAARETAHAWINEYMETFNSRE